MRSTLTRAMVALAMATMGLGGATTVPARPDPLVRLVLEVRELDYPFARSAGNAAALASMVAHASVVGHYDTSSDRTTFHWSSCMIGVTCFPDPHFSRGPEHRDHPVTVQAPPASAGPDHTWRVEVTLPERHNGAVLNTATLVLPVTDLWSNPMVAQDVATAARQVPSYNRFDGAQQQTGVDIDLQAPDVPSVAGAWVRYCPAIDDPGTWSHSGTLWIRVTVFPAGERLFAQGGDLLRWRPEHGQCLDR